MSPPYQKKGGGSREEPAPLATIVESTLPAAVDSVKEDEPVHLAQQRDLKLQIFRHLRLWLQTGSDYHRAAATIKAGKLAPEAVTYEIL